MKKAILLLCLAAGLMSCAKETAPKEKPSAGVPMTFEISVTETKAEKTAWATGDKIYVFFNSLATKYLILEYNGSNWTNTSGGGTLLSTDFDGLGTRKLTAVHFPVAVDVTCADSEFTFTSGGKPVYNYYLYETGKDYTVSETTVSATLTMQKPTDFVQLLVPIDSEAARYVLCCPQIKPVACRSVDTDGNINEDIQPPGAGLSGFGYSSPADVVGVFSGRLNNPSETSYTFSLIYNGRIYTLTRSAALTAGNAYNFPVLGDDRWSPQHAELSARFTTAMVSAGTTSYTWTIFSNTNWTLTPGAGVTASATSGSGNAEVTLSFSANESSSAATYTATVSAQGCENVTLTITQNGTGTSSTITDEITSADLAATSSTYADFSNVACTSDARYAGNSAKDGNNMRFRSSNSNSGLVSTTSGGKLKSVKITFADRLQKIDIYGSTSGYVSASDLYVSSKQGTKIGSLSDTGTITFGEEYRYVGIRSNNGSVTVSKIEIEWKPVP